MNSVFGALLLVEYPAIIGAAFGHEWYAVQHNNHRPTLNDFLRSVPADFSPFLPAVLGATAAGVAAIASAVAINGRRWRPFSIVAGYAMCMAFPFGTIAGLPTAIVSMRQSSAANFVAHRRRGPT